MKIKNWKLKINHGFTLIDLMVSMAIMTLLTLTSVISFIQGERTQNLNNAAEVLASQLRAIENMAIVGKEVDTGGSVFEVPRGGFGIQFSKPSVGETNIPYLFFADMNRDLMYTGAGGSRAFPTLVDKIINFKEQYSLPKDVIISGLKIDDVDVDWGDISLRLQIDKVNIVFKTSTAKVYVDGKTNVSRVSIILTHQKTDKSKTIIIYPTSRQISVE